MMMMMMMMMAVMVVILSSNDRYAAVLIGRITGLARPSVRPSVRLLRTGS